MERRGGDDLRKLLGSGCAGLWSGLPVGLVGPGLLCPRVFREGGEEQDGGLVVDAPGREPLAVEGSFELGVEAFGVLTHAVELLVSLGGGWGGPVGTHSG